MQSFIAACVVAIVVALGAYVVLNFYQAPVDTAFTSSTGTRVTPETGHLVTRS
jgi:hypothetical protein